MVPTFIRPWIAPLIIGVMLVLALWIDLGSHSPGPGDPDETTGTSAPPVFEAPSTAAPSTSEERLNDVEGMFAESHTTVTPMTGGGRSGFISTCAYLHSAAVDPIVYPGSTTDSHDHDFFANTSTDEHTITSSLIQSGETTCSHADDLSAYWTPAATDGGRKAAVQGTSMYYFTDNVADPGAMEPIPVGLRVIAGDARATGPQPGHVGWFQEHRRAGNRTRPGREQMIDARRSRQVTLRINFPQCWNGTELDSPDHKSHMAYTRGGACPASHPVLLPQLSIFVRYAGDGGDDFELSSGPWYTMHADFWNAWHPEAFEELLDRCRTSHCDRVRSR